jgi:hypothetical protein
MLARVITDETIQSTDVQTLSQRLTLGKLPAPEALRYAMQLGEALRRIHEDGHAHGAVSPQVVNLEGGTVQLLPGDSAGTEVLAPYLAPERLQGRGPDACSDIFSFGALLYEMLTARPAFKGWSREVLPPRIGHEGFDRLVSTCLSREPSGRWQRMQQVAMELKLLAASDRRSETNPALRQEQIKAALRNELRQVEARWSTLLEQQQQMLACVSGAAAEDRAKLDETYENLKAVCAQLASVDARLAAALERLTHAEDVAQATTESIGGIDQSVKTQTDDTVGIRAAIARTEDLVERVVEAVEALQNMVLDQAGDDAVK